MLYPRSVIARDMMKGDRYSLRRLGVFTKARITRRFKKNPAMDIGVKVRPIAIDCPVEGVQSVLFDNSEQYVALPMVVIPSGQLVELSSHFVKLVFK